MIEMKRDMLVLWLVVYLVRAWVEAAIPPGIPTLPSDLGKAAHRGGQRKLPHEW